MWLSPYQPEDLTPNLLTSEPLPSFRTYLVLGSECKVGECLSLGEVNEEKEKGKGFTVGGERGRDVGKDTKSLPEVYS